MQAKENSAGAKRRTDGLPGRVVMSKSNQKMNEPNPTRVENLVRVHKVRNEWEGNLIVSFLRDNAIAAMLEVAPSIAPLDAAEEFSGSDKTGNIMVLQHDADRARALVEEFLARQSANAT
jgi:hypothetical protein